MVTHLFGIEILQNSSCQWLRYFLMPWHSFNNSILQILSKESVTYPLFSNSILQYGVSAPAHDASCDLSLVTDYIFR